MFIRKTYLQKNNESIFLKSKKKLVKIIELIKFKLPKLSLTPYMEEIIKIENKNLI